MLKKLVMLGVAGFSISLVNVNAQALTAKERKEGWVSLFDGKTLNGWKNYNAEGVRKGWQVVDGTMKHTKNGGDLITVKEYQDFELKLEWKIAKGANSGIFLGVREGEQKIYYAAIEMQILDDKNHPDGVHIKHRSGACYALSVPPKGAVNAVGEWNKVRILKQGDHYQFFLNDVKTADFKTESEKFKKLVANSKFKKWRTFAKYKKGNIGLQDHGDVVQFKNLKIREIKK